MTQDEKEYREKKQIIIRNNNVMRLMGSDVQIGITNDGIDDLEQLTADYYTKKAFNRAKEIIAERECTGCRLFHSDEPCNCHTKDLIKAIEGESHE